MANTIALRKEYVNVLDTIYAREALSRILDANPELVRAGATADTVLLPKMTLQGLADYGRNTGYVDGDVTFEWQTHQFTQDRGRKFVVDTEDNLENAGVIIGNLSSEFIRTKVAPEIDAYRFATLSSKAGNSVSITSITSDNVETYFDNAIQTMGDAGVDLSSVISFINFETEKAMKQAKMGIVLNQNAAVDRRVYTLDGVTLIVVPQTRFYTAIEQVADGDGGYSKDSYDGLDIKMLFVDRNAALGIVKHTAPKIISSDANQSADGWIFGYRVYHDLFVPDNKVNGIYLVKGTS